jgi:hypothetical protein
MNVFVIKLWSANDQPGGFSAHSQQLTCRPFPITSIAPFIAILPP